MPCGQKYQLMRFQTDSNIAVEVCSLWLLTAGAQCDWATRRWKEWVRNCVSAFCAISLVCRRSQKMTQIERVSSILHSQMTSPSRKRRWTSWVLKAPQRQRTQDSKSRTLRVRLEGRLPAQDSKQVKELEPLKNLSSFNPVHRWGVRREKATAN